MAFTNEQHRNRYANDPAHRAHKLAANRRWRMARRDVLNAEWSEKWRTDAAFRESRKAAAWAQRLRKYGLTPADYERMLREQDGLCALCHRRPARGLVVDHCHATSRVRGLLCDKCNSGLGFFDDDAERMRTGAGYVDRANGIREARFNIRAVIPTAAFAVTLNAPRQRRRGPSRKRAKAAPKR
jgi:recombination endonuclease VII